MKIQFGNPPNYDEIIKHFPVEKNRSVVFTFGETLYVGKTSRGVSGDLMKHEQRHTKQQKAVQEELGPEATLEDGAKEWWRRYFTDKDFRFQQEAEAYGVQYKELCRVANRHSRRAGFKQMAGDLSGPIYGHLCNGKQAEAAILENVPDDVETA